VNCLITGINGFIGKRLAEELKKNSYSVTGMDFSELKENHGGIYKVDISNWRELEQLKIKERIDLIIHLVAITDPNAEKQKIFSVNEKGTQNICRFAEKNNIKKIIYISTVSVYSSYNIKYIDESTTEEPCNFYGESKLNAESIIKASGLNYSILRPTNIFGVKNDKYSNYFSKLKFRGRRLGIVFYYNRNTHLLFLQDLLDVISECIENVKSDNQTFIVSEDENNTFEKYILKETMKCYNLKKKILPFPLFWKNTDGRIFIAKKIKEVLNIKFRFGVYYGLKKYLSEI